MTKPKVEILRTAQSRHNSEEFANLKRVQEELERVNSLLTATLESSANGIVVVDSAGITITFNQQYIKMWNLPEAMVEAKNTQERWAFLASQLKDPDGFLKRVKELSDQPEAEGYDIIELKDGRIFERYSKPQWLGEKVIGRVVNFRNITEQKRAEEALRQNEASMAAAQRIAHVGNWETDIPTNSLYWSDEIYRIFGLAPQEFSATVDAFFSRVHPDDLAYVLKAVDDAIAGRQGYNVDHRIIQSGGAVRFVHQEAEVTYDEMGKPLRFIGIVQDVTERKQAEEALQEREQLLRLVLDTIPQFVFWKDKNSVLLGCNANFAKIAGVGTPENIIGKTDYDLPWKKEEADFFRAVDRRVMDSNTPELRIVEPQLHADGKQAWLETNKIPLHDATGNVVGILGTFEDISERIKLEQQIRESLERRSRQVQLSTQVAQEIAAATDLSGLFRRMVTQVKEQLGYYHAQLLRYNPAGDALVLVAGYGDIGLRMVEARYQRSVEADLMGIAAGAGASTLQADVSIDPDWRAYPLLPETRGELVVPIKLGRENAQAQITALKSFINNGFDGFIVTAIDPVAVAQVAREALNKGMRVVTHTTDLGAENQTALVWAVEYDMGYMLGWQAGEWAKKHLPPGKTLKLGVLNYRLIPQVIQREEGIIAGIEAVFGHNIEIVGNETAGDSIQSWPIAEAWLQAHPDLNMIVGINDASALGAYQAVIAVGKNDPDTFFVGGIDAIPEALAAIKAGGVYQATVDQPAKVMGALTVRALVAAIKGQPYNKVYAIQCAPINPSNVDQYLSARDNRVPLKAETAVEDVLAGLDLRGLKIGLSVLTLTNPFFVALVKGAKEEAERLGIELVINDPKQVWGVLDVQSDVAGLLNAEDQLALEGFCAQFAAAIESTRLRQEMEDRLRELNALQRLTSHEGWQAFRATREQAAQAYLFDQTSVRATTVAELGLLHNGTAQKELLASASAVSNSHIVARPMAVRGEIIGALGIQDDADNPLSPEDQAFLAAVAQQVAEALERARLLEQTQKRAAGLEAVAQVSAVTSTTLETQKLLQTAVDLTKINFGLYHAHIYLLDEAGENLSLAVGVGEVGQQMVAQGWQIPLNHKHSLVAQAARTRQSVMVNDVHESPDFLPNPLLPETRSEVAIPLIAGDRLLGVLDVQADEINHFTEEDMQVKTVLAAQIATALRNANLYQQTQAALAETESLYNAGRRLNETGNLQEIVAAVVEGLSVPTINRAVLMMFERDSAGEAEVMTVTANWHSGEGTLPTPIGVQYPRAMFAALGVLLSSDPLFFDDVQHDERVDPAMVAAWQQSNIRAMAVLPLAVGSRQLGSLLLEAEEPHPFTEHEIRLSRSIMGQATVAIENQRLFNATRVALAEVEATQRRYTVQAWETYRIKNKGLSHEQVREGVTPLAENLLPEISKTLAQKRPPTADGRRQLIDRGQPSAVGGQLLVPLTVRGETIGVLGLQETDELRAWSPEEITLIEAIADQLAQAAENIRLIDETQQRAAREKRVNEISEKIQATQSLEEALQVAVKEVGLSLQASQTSVQLEVK